MEKGKIPYEVIKIIFSYLRKNAKSVCMFCGCVCIWDKKVKEYYLTPNLYYNISHLSSTEFYVQNIYCNDCKNKICV